MQSSHSGHKDQAQIIIFLTYYAETYSLEKSIMMEGWKEREKEDEHWQGGWTQLQWQWMHLWNSEELGGD